MLERLLNRCANETERFDCDGISVTMTVGYKPNTIITFQHGFPWPAITTTLGQAAQNTETFEDHNIVRPVFGRAR